MEAHKGEKVLCKYEQKLDESLEIDGDTPQDWLYSPYTHSHAFYKFSSRPLKGQ